MSRTYVFLIPIILVGILLSSCTKAPINSDAASSESSSTTEASSAMPADATYMKNLRHIGILSADDQFVWCGKDGRYSMENGYGNQSYPIEGADPASFEHIGTDDTYGSYFRDTNWIYFAGRYEGTSCNKLNNPDRATFAQIIGPVAKDASHVYVWGEQLADVDAPSFTLLNTMKFRNNNGTFPYDLIYFSDKTSVYFWVKDGPWMLQRIVSANPSTFKVPKSDTYPGPLEEVKKNK